MLNVLWGTSTCNSSAQHEHDFVGENLAARLSSLPCPPRAFRPRPQTPEPGHGAAGGWSPRRRCGSCTRRPWLCSPRLGPRHGCSTRGGGSAADGDPARERGRKRFTAGCKSVIGNKPSQNLKILGLTSKHLTSELRQRLNEKGGAPDTTGTPILPAVTRHTGTCGFEGTDRACSARSLHVL